MTLPRVLVAPCVSLLLVVLAMSGAGAQDTSGPRFWVAGALGLGSQDRGCTCLPSGAPDPTAGVAATASLGATSRRFGIGLSEVAWVHPDFVGSGNSRSPTFRGAVLRYDAPLAEWKTNRVD